MIILAFVGWGTYKGYRRGLFIELVGTFGLVLAISGSFLLLDIAVKTLKPYIEGFGFLIPILAFGLLFVSIFWLVGYVGRRAKRMIHYSLLGSADALAGAALGLLKITFSISSLFWLIGLVGIQMPIKYTSGTFIYPVVATMGPKSIRLLSYFLPFVNDFVDIIKRSLNR